MKKTVVHLLLLSMLSMLALAIDVDPAYADFDIPTVDQDEIDRMFGLTSDGAGSDGCNTLKGEIGQARNQIRTWNTERELSSSWQEKARLTININNGVRWVKFASIIYDTNCSYAFFGGTGEGPMS